MPTLNIPAPSLQIPTGLAGQIKLVVPSDGLNGALLMWVDYRINTDRQFCNSYSLLSIKPVYLYDHTKLRHLPDDKHAFDLAHTNEVFDAISLALKYFQFAIKFMDGMRLPPPSYECFLQTLNLKNGLF